MKRVLVLLLAILVVCTGCSLDVESYLRPPRVGGQQRAVQAALETYLRDSGGDVRYTLEYPVEGAHTAAFILCDEQGFPVKDNAPAHTALAFYSRASAPDVTRMNRLQRSGDEWVSVADTAGEGAAVRQVAFGDLDGDGTAEILTGWTTYSTGSYRLAIYGSDGGLTPLSRDKVYSAMYVGDLTAAGYDSLLLLTLGGGDRATASLETLQNGTLVTLDTAPLDGGIRQFGGMTLCRLAEDIHGLFVDGFKAEDVTVTELIYYDDTGLCTPFYDAAANANTVTARVGRTAARDVDGDALVEIPYNTVLEGYTAADVGGTVTLWRGWDYATHTWQNRSHTLLNEADGYMVVLDEEPLTYLSTRYDRDTRTLSLRDTRTGQDWLWVSVGEDTPPVPDVDGRWIGIPLFSNKKGDSGYYAWYDPTVLTAEKIHYMMIRLSGEGGGTP